MKRTIVFVFMMILGGLLLTRAFALESDETLTVLQGLQQDPNGNFTTLVSLLESSGLAEELGGQQVTLFAPTNAAFDELGSEELTRLSEDDEALSTILRHHVLPGSYTVLELDRAEEGTLRGLSDEPFVIAQSAGGLTVNGVGLISTDVDNAYSNGYIHVVDRVMTAEALAEVQGNTADTATTAEGNQTTEATTDSDETTTTGVTPAPTASSATQEGEETTETVTTNLESDENITVLEGLQQDSENFSTLLSLLQTSGLTEQLQSGAFTLFAPTNAAFETYSNGDMESISADPNVLSQLLNLHVLGGAYTVNQLQDAEQGSLLTLEGQPFAVETTAGGLMVNGVSLNSADVDNLYSNGVIHVVDTVMNSDSNQTPTQ